MRTRQKTVTSLVTDVADEGSRLVFLDRTGPLRADADGRAAEGMLAAEAMLAAEDAWRFGVDPAAVARAAHGYAILAYSGDVDRLRTAVGAYRTACPPETPLRVVLRPGPPETDSADHLVAKVAAVQDAADAVDFQHYGLNTYAHLDRIAAAWRGAASSRH